MHVNNFAKKLSIKIYQLLTNLWLWPDNTSKIYFVHLMEKKGIFLYFINLVLNFYNRAIEVFTVKIKSAPKLH